MPTHKYRRGGGGARYATKVTELLPHLARPLDVDWVDATRYAGLLPEGSRSVDVP
jgi:hypothetical protein